MRENIFNQWNFVIGILKKFAQLAECLFFSSKSLHSRAICSPRCWDLNKQKLKYFLLNFCWSSFGTDGIYFVMMFVYNLIVNTSCLSSNLLYTYYTYKYKVSSKNLDFKLMRFSGIQMLYIFVTSGAQYLFFHITVIRWLATKWTRWKDGVNTECSIHPSII